MLVELSDINKTYGRVRANQEINLRLEPGRIYGLLGENGAGKSTLMRILAGHTRPDKGRILFDGRDPGRLNPSSALTLGVGMLYQDPLDIPALSVLENFVLGGRKRSRREAADRLEELAHGLDFSFTPSQRVSELTVGERQQLELLRLLDVGAKVLILDEPTTGITLPQKKLLFSTLRKLSADRNRTIIVVTHKLEDALGLCHQLIIMRQGRLEALADPPYDPRRVVQIMFGPQAGDEDRSEAAPPSAETPWLKLSDADFVGEKYALTNAGLQVRPGEIVGLAGLEGSGQELLLSGLAGLSRMSRGRLEFEGATLSGRAYRAFRRAGIHFLPAARLEQGLFPDLSLTDHVCLAFPEQKKRLDRFFQEECVDRFRLKAHPSTCACALSGGNQQRLLLSLIPPDSKLLLMEHPTRGLDVGSAREVWQHLEERCRRGASLIFSSADLDEVLEHSHRVLVFYNRALIADLPVEQVNVETLGSLMAGRELAA